MRELLTILESLKDELDQLTGDLLDLFIIESEYKPHSRQGYSLLPSLNMEEKILGVDDDPEIMSESDEQEEEEEDHQINQYLLVYQPKRPDYFGWVIRRVPRQQLGYGVLGRAFPYFGLIEVASDLYGNDFEEVKTHEILHMTHPEKSEHDIRMLTKMSLPFTPRWH